MIQNYVDYPHSHRIYYWICLQMYFYISFSFDSKSFCSSTSDSLLNLFSDVLILDHLVHPHWILRWVSPQLFLLWMVLLSPHCNNKQWLIFVITLIFRNLLYFVTWSSGSFLRLIFFITMKSFDRFLEFIFLVSFEICDLLHSSPDFVNFVVSYKVHWPSLLKQGFPALNQIFSFLKFYYFDKKAKLE